MMVLGVASGGSAVATACAAALSVATVVAVVCTDIVMDAMLAFVAWAHGVLDS